MVRRLLTRRTAPHALRDRLILFVVLAGVVAAFGYAYSRRNVHHIHIAPGGSMEYRVDLAMQKAFHSKSFVEEMGLPVRCRVLGTGADDGMSVSVTATGHGIHRMWATLYVHALDDADPGTRIRLLDFTIDGDGGWPRATVYVHVD